MLSGYAGVDTMELAVFSDFADGPNEPPSDECVARLNAFGWLSETARGLREGGVQQTTAFYGEDPVTVYRTGGTVGRGRRGGFYPYRFTWRGCDFMAAPFERAGHRANFTIRVAATFMLSFGGHPGRAWEDLEAFLRRFFGAVVKRCSVSRVDIFGDMPGTPVSRFVNLFERGMFVRRTRRVRKRGMVGAVEVSQDEAEEVQLDGKGAEWSTLHLGLGGVLSCRFYDKLLELARPEMSGKRDMMKIQLWNGAEPDELTRVEFQLRNAALKKHGSSTIQSLSAKLRGLAEYLVTRWLVVCDSLDRSHTNRKEVHPLWEKLRATFSDRFCVEPTQDIDDLLPDDVLAVGRQGLGCLMSFLAKSGEPPAQPSDVFPQMVEVLRFLFELYGPERAWEEITDRYADHVVRHHEVREALYRRLDARAHPGVLLGGGPGCPNLHGLRSPPLPASEA
ncbi:hypothetical protein VT03_28070 [Planctomyces sp. SH-PL14]|nr:hypothetical protein VT03_28070 [Planctomyces sp. SH-PL14]